MLEPAVNHDNCGSAAQIISTVAGNLCSRAIRGERLVAVIKNGRERFWCRRKAPPGGPDQEVASVTGSKSSARLLEEAERRCSVRSDRQFKIAVTSQVFPGGVSREWRNQN